MSPGEGPLMRRHASMGRGAGRPLLLLAGIALCVLMVHWRVVLLGETYVERDALRFTLPMRAHLASTLAQGRVPEWWDGVGFGEAFAASPVAMVVAPTGWLLSILGSPFGFDLFTLLHIVAAGMGTALLARRLGASGSGALLAGSALAVSGYVTSVIANGFAQFVAYTPWVAWSTDRLASLPTSAGIRLRARGGAAVAATVALQLMAGEPASILVALLLAAGIVASRTGGFRRLPEIVTAMLLSLPLAAVALLPGLALLRESARGAGLGGDGLAWSMHPGRALEWIWPLAYGAPVGDGWFAGLALLDGPGDPFWSFSQHLGFPLLLLALLAGFAPGRRGLLVTSAAFVALALGRHGPIYEPLRTLLHLEHLVNFPEKLVYGAMILWCALAGVGLTRAFAEPARGWLLRAAAGGAVLLVLGCAGLASTSDALVRHLDSRARSWAVPLDVSRGLAAAMEGGLAAAAGTALFAAAVGIHARRPPSHGVMSAAAPLLAMVALIGPLVIADGEVLALAPREIAFTRPTLLEALPDLPPGAPRPRLLRVPPPGAGSSYATPADMAREIEETLDTNVGARFGLSVLPGFDSAETARSRRFWLEAGRRIPLPAFTKLLGVRYVAAKSAEKLRAALRPISRIDDGVARGWSLLEAPGTRPPAFLAPRTIAVASDVEALRLLTLPGRDDDLGRIALVNPRAVPQGRAPLTPCAIVATRPEEIGLVCNGTEAGHAVVLQEAASGWSADVDGRPERILAADGLFLSVPVGPGEHRITFRYRTPGLRAGAIISLLSWCALGMLPLLTRGAHGGDDATA